MFPSRVLAGTHRCLADVLLRNSASSFNIGAKNFAARGRVLLSSQTSAKQADPPTESTLNVHEVAKFSRYADSWWDELGEAAPLHALNSLRVPLVKNGLLSTTGDPGEHPGDLPLSGRSIVDVGCGGGILSESLARLGAQVVAIDAAQENIQVAEQHAAHSCSLSSAAAGGLIARPQYRCQTVEQTAVSHAGQFDAVVASEVLEHVDNQPLFVDMCCRLLKPGGSLFVTTLNRTRMSWLLAIVGGEHVARVLPAGTHDWNKFVTPSELHVMFSANGLVLRLLHGMRYNPITGRWSWCSDTSCCYAVHALLPSTEKTTPTGL